MAEEMISFVDMHGDGGKNGTESNNNKIKNVWTVIIQNHTFNLKKKLIVNGPVYMICSMEESVMANVLKFTYNKSGSCKFLLRVKYLESACVSCDIVANTCQPMEAKIVGIPSFE